MTKAFICDAIRIPIARYARARLLPKLPADLTGALNAQPRPGI